MAETPGERQIRTAMSRTEFGCLLGVVLATVAIVVAIVLWRQSFWQSEGDRLAADLRAQGWDVSTADIRVGRARPALEVSVSGRLEQPEAICVELEARGPVKEYRTVIIHDGGRLRC